MSMFLIRMHSDSIADATVRSSTSRSIGPTSATRSTSDVIAELTAWAAAVARGRASVRVVVLARRGQDVLRRRRRHLDGEDGRLHARTRTCATRRLRRAMFAALDALPVPLIGRVHGAALGGGAGLAAVCDIVVAEERRVFGFTEVKLGILPAVISPFVAREDRPIGRARAVPDRRALLGRARPRDRPRARGRAGRRARRRRSTRTSGEILTGAPRGDRRGQGAHRASVGAGRSTKPRRRSTARGDRRPGASRPKDRKGCGRFSRSGSRPGSLELSLAEVITMIRRLLIANRGEIARPDHRARAASSASRASPCTRTPTRTPPHVAAADRAVAIGPAPAARELPVDSRRSSTRRGRAAPTPSIPGTGSCPRTRRSPRRATRPGSSSSARRPTSSRGWARRSRRGG